MNKVLVSVLAVVVLGLSLFVDAFVPSKSSSRIAMNPRGIIELPLRIQYSNTKNNGSSVRRFLSEGNNDANSSSEPPESLSPPSPTTPPLDVVRDKPSVDSDSKLGKEPVTVQDTQQIKKAFL